MEDSENSDSGFESVFGWAEDAVPKGEALWLILDEVGTPIAPIPMQS